MTSKAAPYRPSWRPALIGGLAVALATGLTLAGLEFATPAQAQIAVQNQGYVPFSDAPINYRTHPLTDPVAALQKQIEAGKVKLEYEPGHGYLKSVLKLLKIPVESQALVFSKTSFQYPHISVEHPRALYYNDDVYVGAVHQGKTIEIVSFDPMQGAIFYLLNEQQADKPAFERAELDCTQCHIAASTRGVPGVMLRSVYPTETGSLAPRTPSYITDQKSPWKERWGGWYVTGALADGSLANGAASSAQAAADASGTVSKAIPALTRVDAKLDTSVILTKTSDSVALLVLAHQTQMHNLITLTNYQTRLALHALAKSSDGKAPEISSLTALDALPEATRNQIEKPAEQLIRYLLFSKETPLGGMDATKAVASSAFARQFAAQGVRDSRKRSLRDFDLNTRIFRYPCSYLIYSEAFDAIPDPAKGYIYHRLLQVLTGQDQSEDFANLSAADRQAILSILIETKPGLPQAWQAYGRSNGLRVAALAPARIR
ncbi:MAG: hypothetical protein EON96_05830 [Caulobacteraceae bacterium]|nr:MAG: hypothetical protein EON96_05830 [Caulobacteraceae bacterium]